MTQLNEIVRFEHSGGVHEVFAEIKTVSVRNASDREVAISQQYLRMRLDQAQLISMGVMVTMNMEFVWVNNDLRVLRVDKPPVNDQRKTYLDIGVVSDVGMEPI